MLSVGTELFHFNQLRGCYAYLIKKRQRRAAIKAAMLNVKRMKALFMDDMTAPSDATSSDALLSKSWDEVQCILSTDLEFVRTLAGFEEKTLQKRVDQKYKAQADHLLATRQDL